MCCVSTLVVEWIEIVAPGSGGINGSRVSTLVVEWIEIPIGRHGGWLIFVSTLVVEWIEMRT